MALCGVLSLLGPTRPGFVSSGHAEAPITRTSLQTSPRPAHASAGPHVKGPTVGSISALAMTGVALTLLGAPRRSRPLLSQEQSSAVIMHARSARPTTPAGSPKNKRRIRAGRMRPIFRGRQLAVRVNPKTNKPVRYKMHVMPGDTVQVMKGKDHGKVTEVLRIYPKWNKILCLGVNYCIKHVRPQREDEVGQRVQVEAPMHSSWVMHYDEEEEVAGLLGVRFNKKTLKNGSEIVKKVRYNKSTGNEIPVRAPSKWIPVLDRVEDED